VFILIHSTLTTKRIKSIEKKPNKMYLAIEIPFFCW